MAAAIGAVAVGGVVLAAATSLAARPALLSAGPRLLGVALGAAVGTSAATILPVTGLGAGYALARALSVRGDAVGHSALGAGPIRTWAHAAPVWAGLALTCLVVGFGFEPSAWEAIHRTRGAPVAAVAAWAELGAGVVQDLPGGGALAMDEGGALRFVTAEQSWEGRLQAPRPATSGEAWEFGEVELRSLAAGRAGTWTAQRLAIGLDDSRRARWGAPPESPWTLGLGALLERGRTSERAALVLHRRLALACAVPLLALAGWLLGWSETGRRDRLATARGVGALLLLCAVFGVARLADHGVRAGELGGAAAGWLPAVLAGLAVAALAVIRSRGAAR